MHAQARSFAELLEQALLRYQNRAVETAQVIEELIALAREMRAAEARGEELGLSDDELAFYDALETNDSAVAVLGDETLKMIARELVATVCKNATIDWTVRENVREQFLTSCLAAASTAPVLGGHLAALAAPLRPDGPGGAGGRARLRGA